MSIYANHPLLKGHACIRLLRIALACDPTDIITCEFSTFDIEAAPRYQALSYEWSLKSPLKEIEVMKQPTRIRSNLFNFLARLRSHGYHDYLCDDERNHQVQLMFQIYRKAHSVLVWLGEESHDSNKTLRTIHVLSRTKERDSRLAHMTERSTLWQGLEALSRRKYWTRIWIVQEITVARRLELFCGDEKVPWSTFASACTFPPDLWTPWEQIMRRSAGKWLHHSTMYGLIRSQKRWPMEIESLETLSTRYKKSECEDRRDKIFALFSIASEVRHGHIFNVDYTKDIEGTFISLVAWAISGPLWNGPISTVELEEQRSPTFFKWVNQPLRITLWGLNLGKWSFERHGPLLVAQISPREFRSEPVQVHLHIFSSYNLPTLEFELLALETSNIFLACQNNHWLLPEHAPTLLGGPGLSRSYVPSVFEGLEVGEFSLALQNVAQFLEILLDKLDPSSPISLMGVVAEEDSGDSEEDGASETEWDKRRAESEVLAKPKIRRPPIEQPRR
ncbi:hypothetical protein L207DRAFT_557891 [Hyaloscypha variabilis F]|uniref:Heterokaryon incompatibility domain-containing protein n=1 Tax=Hyaloscypha variabilis (strain UAMH 11265 / GT02V1 / F) TaxID=1149755 RepID=A0A2J6R429_HYAVF|nr:hypothetical protein L207DRAFT_557891 [Hyaloscypha variabilis F]